MSCSSGGGAIINELLYHLNFFFNFAVSTPTTLTTVTIRIRFCLICVSQQTQIAVVGVNPGVARIDLVALLAATMTAITQVMTTVAPGIGFEYGLATINSTDNSVNQHEFDDIMARNSNVNRYVLPPNLIRADVQFLDVFIKIYQNRIIFDILEKENEHQIAFEINDEYTFYCNWNEYCCSKEYDYQSSYSRPTPAWTHQPIIMIFLLFVCVKILMIMKYYLVCLYF